MSVLNIVRILSTVQSGKLINCAMMLYVHNPSSSRTMVKEMWLKCKERENRSVILLNLLTSVLGNFKECELEII